jgi:hypothetical protein
MLKLFEICSYQMHTYTLKDDESVERYWNLENKNCMSWVFCLLLWPVYVSQRFIRHQQFFSPFSNQNCQNMPPRISLFARRSTIAAYFSQAAYRKHGQVAASCQAASVYPQCLGDLTRVLIRGPKKRGGMCQCTSIGSMSHHTPWTSAMSRCSTTSTKAWDQDRKWEWRLERAVDHHTAVSRLDLGNLKLSALHTRYLRERVFFGGGRSASMCSRQASSWCTRTFTADGALAFKLKFTS